MRSTPGIVFYVSPKGNDTWSGKLPDASHDLLDGPFASLLRARDAVRALKGTDKELKEPVTVYLRGGTYFLANTLVLSGEDSGFREDPVTWCAFPGETPILSGGRVVNGWKPYQGSILQAEFPEAKDARYQTRQLFYKGRRQVRARWPKFDPANPIRGGWAFPEGLVPDFTKRAFRFKPGAFPRKWAKPYEGEVAIVIGHGWLRNLVPIHEIDYDNRILWFARDTFDIDLPPWFMHVPLRETSRYYVENILEELSQPGEWCVDTKEGILYFWPPDGVLEDGDVVMPLVDCLVRFRDVQWVNLADLTFTQTTTGDDYHRNRLEGYGAMFPQQGLSYCGEAVHWRGTQHCSIESCHFDQVGGNAIYLERDNYRNLIRGNHIEYSGMNAIVLIGDRPFHPMFNEVVDNHIHHAGVILNYVAGVFLGASDGNLIAHNFIHDMPHHAINLGSNGLGRNFIEYNEIRRVCLEIADTGAINCWMDVPGPWIDAYAERSGHVIRYNLIADVPGCVVEDGKIVDDRTTRGIYLDDCTSNCFVFGNIIIRTGSGLMVHGGKHNVIENNIIFDCLDAVHGDDWPPARPGNAAIRGMYRGNRFLHNIFYSSLPDAMPYSFYAWTENVMERCDDNVFYIPHTSEYRVPGVANGDWRQPNPYAYWQKIGYDRGSVIADPGFINPESEDFRLKPDSPALNLGFQPIDIAKIGIRRKTV